MRKVLIVDDDELMRRMYSDMFLDAGIEPETVAGGAEALDVIRRGDRIDMIFTDYEMPKMDGITFLKKLKEENLCIGVPRYMCTGRYPTKDPKSPLLAVVPDELATEILPKPFDMSRMYKILEEIKK